LRTIFLRRALDDRNEIIRRLAAIDTPRLIGPAITILQDNCTPLDFADALSRAGSLLSTPRSLLRSSVTARLLKRGRPETYRRLEVTPHITLYTDPDVPAEDKQLLLVFTGLHNRPFLPIAAFVQMLPARRFDIAILRDPDILSFEGGIPDYATTLPELTARLLRDLRGSSYAGIATLGISVAALAALRAGILAEARSAIAISPRFTWHIGRLVKGGKIVPAFDLLCACGPRRPTRLFAVYPAGNVTDTEHMERLGKLLPVDIRSIAGTDNHNVVYTLMKAGRLRDLLLDMLEG
jgi:hypothetical protein